MLGERRAAILRLIIEYYIKTGEPIGSKTLCNLLPYAVSSATIRNEMAHLSNLATWSSAIPAAAVCRARMPTAFMWIT